MTSPNIQLDPKCSVGISHIFCGCHYLANHRQNMDNAQSTKGGSHHPHPSPPSPFTTLTLHHPHPSPPSPFTTLTLHHPHPHHPHPSPPSPFTTLTLPHSCLHLQECLFPKINSSSYQYKQLTSCFITGTLI